MSADKPQAAKKPAKKKAAATSSARIRIEQYRSGIQAPIKHKLILRGLGLEKMHRVVERPDNAAIRGMVNKIPHLVRIVG